VDNVARSVKLEALEYLLMPSQAQKYPSGSGAATGKPVRSLLAQRHCLLLLSLLAACANEQSPPGDGQAGQGGSSAVAPPLKTPGQPECTGTPCSSTAECCPGTSCEAVNGAGGGEGIGAGIGEETSAAPAAEKLCLTEPGNLCRSGSECATNGQQSFCNSGRCCITDEGGESCRVAPGYACSSNDGCTTLTCIDGVCGYR
jgi:hypothetical protein